MYIFMPKQAANYGIKAGGRNSGVGNCRDPVGPQTGCLTGFTGLTESFVLVDRIHGIHGIHEILYCLEGTRMSDANHLDPVHPVHPVEKITANPVHPSRFALIPSNPGLVG
jgi:hypothetical protein